MTALLAPAEDTPLTPLPWALLQTTRQNYLLGRRGRMECIIAQVTLSSDATLIFRAVHAFPPLRSALRMVTSKLYSDGGYGGVTGLGAHFNQQDYLLLKRALAMAEGEVGS